MGSEKLTGAVCHRRLPEAAWHLFLAPVVPSLGGGIYGGRAAAVVSRITAVWFLFRSVSLRGGALDELHADSPYGFGLKVSEELTETSNRRINWA